MKALLVVLPLLVACKKGDDRPSDPPAPTPVTGSRIAISVTEQGFQPRDIAVPAGKEITLVFERKTDQTCAKEVVLDTGDGKKIEKTLPLDTPVEIAATFPKAGKLGYACGMDMVKGTITVQ